MARVLVAVEDTYYQPMERIIRRACESEDGVNLRHLVKFLPVQGDGGFGKFINRDFNIAISGGIPKFGKVEGLCCILDADSAGRSLGVDKPPIDSAGLEEWHESASEAFRAKLIGWGVPEDFPLHGVLLRWNLESVILATYDRWWEPNALRALGIQATNPSVKWEERLKSCRLDPRSVEDTEFVSQWRSPGKCVNDLIQALGGGQLAKKDPRRTDLINAVTKHKSDLESILARLPDVAHAAKSISELVGGNTE